MIEKPYTIAEIKAKVASDEYSAELMLQHAMLHLDALAAQPAVSCVFLVATGETVDGQETYTRHEGAPPPLCDFETLYTAAQPARAGGDAPDWREQAARVMDALAENQERINAESPEHVKCYPSWEHHARWCRWHAEMFRTGKPVGSGAGAPAVVAALAAAPQPAPAEQPTSNTYAHTQDLPALAAVGHHDLDDATRRQQAPQGVAGGAGESGAVAGLDRDDAGVGIPADESCALGRLRPQPHEVAGGLTDQFRGDNIELVRNIRALLELDAAKALVPHGVGGHARTLLSAAAVRLSAEVEQPAGGAVPAGFKLVPLEPTEAMFTRFSQQIDTGAVYVGGFLQAYRCMLDAAPDAPAAVERDAPSALPEASPATKGQCNDERACSACYSGQGSCIHEAGFKPGDLAVYKGPMKERKGETYRILCPYDGDFFAGRPFLGKGPAWVVRCEAGEFIELDEHLSSAHGIGSSKEGGA